LVIGGELLYIPLNPESTPFNLDDTLSCGQVFRWEKKYNYWYGIVGQTIVKVRQDQNRLYFQTFPEEMGADFISKYFRLDDDLPKIILNIDKDETIHKAINGLYGLRIIRQDIWESIISFICATFSNIPRIKGMIHNISRKFGRKIVFNGLAFYTFPSVDVLSNATLSQLLDCRLGFRAKYIKSTSSILKESWTNLDHLNKLPYFEAKHHLLTLPGVGPKVADCILLFSLERLEAFPVDVWVRRVLFKHYCKHFQEVESLSKKDLALSHYNQLSDFGRKYFGKYAGYAQEYLFHYYRFNSSACF